MRKRDVDRNPSLLFYHFKSIGYDSEIEGISYIHAIDAIESPRKGALILHTFDTMVSYVDYYEYNMYYDKREKISLGVDFIFQVFYLNYEICILFCTEEEYLWSVYV